MRNAVVHSASGKVVNVVELAPPYVPEEIPPDETPEEEAERLERDRRGAARATYTPPVGYELVPTDTANIGDTYSGSSFTPGPDATGDPLTTDKQRLYDYMPASGSTIAGLVTAYIADNTKPPEIRATMAALRSLIRVVRGEL